MNVKTEIIDENDVLIIKSKGGAMVTVSLVKGNSAYPRHDGHAIKISGTLASSSMGYSPGNSGYGFRKYRQNKVFIQPGTVIPHESQVPRCYLVAAGAMFWRTSSRVYDEQEENAMYWRHGELVFNKEEGEITFPQIDAEVIRLWETVSYPLLQKQLKEIEDDQ